MLTQIKRDPDPTAGAGTQAPDKYAELEKTVKDQQALMSQMAQQMTALNTTINTKLTNLTTKEVPRQEKQDDLDPVWSEFEPKSRKAVEATVEHKTADLESRILNKVETTTAEREKRTRWDSQAVKDFPQLLDGGHELTKEYNRLWNTKVQEDATYKNNPSAVYDTANLAYANLVRRGRIVPEAFSDEARRLISIADGQLMPINGATPKNETELDESAKFFIRKFNITPERYIANMRK